ncbi:MAG: flagellar hook-associated protein FlgK [Actinomycetota bacterium]
MTVINNALSGALAAQAALNTTSQNTANVMTPGYTRQGVLLTAVSLSRTSGINPGDGVAVPSLLRFSDSYKNQQMWQAASGLGQYSTAQPYLTQLEQVMGDDTANINAGLDNFFGALNAASVEPTSSPLRQQVITAADALAQRFNNLRQLLSTQRQSVYQQRTAVVSQINELTTEIAAFNQKISAANSTGTTPSGLIDERDLRIDKLASLVGLQVIDQPDGSRSIALRGGQPLVVGAVASSMAVSGTPSGAQVLTLKFASESFTLASGNLGGQLGGLDDFESKVLAPQIQSIADMASGMAAQVNTKLAAGFDMNGNPGAPLFDFDPTSTNAMLTVHAGVMGQDLAFSASATLPGNSDNLLALIDLRNQPVAVSALGSTLLGDAYTQLVGKLGTDSQQNQASLKTAQTVRNQAEESWKSTSGVNSDEEAINLVQFQQMYQANMKVIAVANQLFDATLAMFG